jgi:hypothetical protein
MVIYEDQVNSATRTNSQGIKQETCKEETKHRAVRNFVMEENKELGG